MRDKSFRKSRYEITFSFELLISLMLYENDESTDESIEQKEFYAL
jgi:hypothetical protein